MNDTPKTEDLNHQVAERIMGWTLRTIDDPATGRWYKYENREENTLYRTPDCGWNPCENIAQAWEVIEHITDPNHYAKKPHLGDFAFQFIKSDLWAHLSHEAARKICEIALQLAA